MSILRMVSMELWHRKLNFAMALLAIAVAVGYAVRSITSIRVHRWRTEALVAEADDNIRKTTKLLGFNINILPANQNLSEFYANDFGEKTMPYEFVTRLANSKNVEFINHLRPALVGKVQWPEYKRQVILMGVSGVVPWTHRTNPKKPLSQPVPPGKIIIGGVLADELGVRVGDRVTLQQQPFDVHQVYEERGTKDDITVWIDLPAAQSILEKPDQINLIQALECNCSSVDRLGEIEAEIVNVLGDEVQVKELATQALARARARNEVKAQGEQTLATRQRRASIELVSLTVAGSILVGLLALVNVRERRGEIGILRAIGAPTSKIMALFLCKALLLGLLGALIGFGGGYLVAMRTESAAIEEMADLASTELFSLPVLLTILLLTPLLTTLASWIPSVLAASQDPANVLVQE